MQEYNPNLYGDTMGSVAPVINITKLANPTAAPPDVTDIQLAQVYYRQADGTIISYITGTCVLPDFGNFSEARLEYSTDSGKTWFSYGKINSDGTFIVDNVKTGMSYSIRIKIANRMGIVSDGEVSDPIYITGKDQPPSNVASITAIIDPADRTKVNLEWSAVNDIDLRGYQLSEGTVLTPTPITATKYTYTATSSRIHTFSVVAIDNSGNPSDIPAEKQLQIILRPDTPTNLKAIQDNSDRSKLNISWVASAGQDITGYIITCGSQSFFTKETIYTCVIPESGTYEITAKARTVAGYESNAANISIPITIEPGDVTGFTISQDMSDHSLLHLKWDNALYADLAFFEIREGVSWDDGMLVATGITGLEYNVRINQEREYSYWIKAVSRAGKYSQYPANIVAVYDLNPAPVTNIIVSQDINDRSLINVE